MATMKLYRYVRSGHSHRVQLFLSLLGVEATLIDVDLPNGDHKQADFLRKNRFGQVPVLEDGDTVVADSNAILVYLARLYDPEGRWYPAEPVAMAEVQRFLSVAAGPVAYGPAAARLVKVFGATLDHERAIGIANTLFSVLDDHLADRDWLVGGHPTIADIANYSYIAHAPEGGMDLEPYPQLRAWLRRIEGLPGFVPMQASAAGPEALFDVKR
jgi:glutathione S-transferase